MKKKTAIAVIMSLLVFSGCSSPIDKTTTQATTTVSETSAAGETTTAVVTTEKTAITTSETKSTTTSSAQATSVVSSIIPPTEYEYTDADRELQQLLSEKAEIVPMLRELYNIGFPARSDDAALPVITKSWEDTELQFHLQSSELPFTSVDEFKALINECFCGAAASELIDTFCGSVYTTDEGQTTSSMPIITDYNGRVYRVGICGQFTPFDYTTARVKSRTDDEIIFSYFTLEPFIEEEKWSELEGVLKYDDGWKFAWNIMHPELLASDMEIPVQ